MLRCVQRSGPTHQRLVYLYSQMYLATLQMCCRKCAIYRVLLYKQQEYSTPVYKNHRNIYLNKA